MSNDIFNHTLPDEGHLASSQVQIQPTSSRRVRNDQKWDSLKEEIHHLYMTKDNTLHNTIRAVVDQHGFMASERKWKEKLKEWKFEKNIPANDMSFIVAKAEKRAREEGKETIFFHRETQVTRERIEQFKRRKITKGRDVLSLDSPGAGTPGNITYCTPCSESVGPPAETSMEQVKITLEHSEVFSPPSSSSSPRKQIPEVKHSAGITSLPTIFEAASEEGFSTEENEGNTSTSASVSTTAYSLQIRELELWQQKELETAAPGLPALVDESHSNLSRPSSSISPMAIPDPGENFDQLSSRLPPKTLRSTLETIQEIQTCQIESRMQLNSSEAEVSDQPDHGEDSVSKKRQPESSTVHHSVVLDLDANTPDSDTLSQNSSQRTVGQRISLEKAINESLGLIQEGKTLEVIFQQIAEDPVYDFTPHYCSAFCNALKTLQHSLGKRKLSDQALLAIDLLEFGYTRMYSSASKAKTRCAIYRAHISKQSGEYELAEKFYREAVEGCRCLGKKKYQLKCQRILGDYLRSLDRDSDALYLLVETLLEHFKVNPSSTWLNRTSEITLCMSSIQKLHSKMSKTGEMDEVITRIFSISCLGHLPGELGETGATSKSYHFIIWMEFVLLGSGYSKLEMSGISKLCFDFPAPSIFRTGEPRICMGRSRFRKEFGERYRKPGKTVETLEELEKVFGWMVPLVGTDQYNHPLIVHLEKILADCEYQDLTGPGELFPQVMALRNSQEACRELLAQRQVIRRASRLTNKSKYLLVVDGPPAGTSTSSYATSLFSAASTSPRWGTTYSVGSASSYVSNSVFMVP